MTTKNVRQGETLLPILRVLMRTSPDAAMPFKEIVDRALTDMGLDLNCMGERDGRPGVYVPFSNGGFELRARGCILSEGRSWKITDTGKAVVASGKIPERLKTPPPKGPPAPKGPTVSKPKTLAEIFAPKEGLPLGSVQDVQGGSVLSGGLGAVKVPGGVAILAPKSNGNGKALPVVKGAEWVADPYLRSLIASNTPCFTTYEAGNQICKPCPLRLHCGSALASMLSTLSQAIKADADKAPVMAPKQTQKAAASTAAALSGAVPRAVPNLAGRKIRANHDTLCVRSGAAIKAQEEVYFVPGEGIVAASAYESA